MSRAPIEDPLAEGLRAWEERGLRRHLQLPAGLDFCSNDYLALARDPRLIAAARAALEEWGTGAGAARLLRGHLPPHERVERLAAEWLRAERALLFPSGYQANLALLTVLAGPTDVILSDRLNHASLIDASRLARARVSVFEHNDAADLERCLAASRGARRRLIAVESVYSMTGDLAPLQDFERLAREHDAWLLVDEAHAAGLYGPGGAGLGVREDPETRILGRMVTGGKALGVCGAFVAGRATVVEALLQWGRSFVFTTAPPPSTAAALERAIEIVRAEPERGEQAHAAAGRLRAALREAGVEAGGHSPIVPIVLGDPERALRVAAAAQEAGFDVRAVRPPSVPAGTSRLRIVCHADHTPDQVLRLARVVAEAAHAYPAAPVAPPAPRPLVVAGTDTGVGKTVVSALLVRSVARTGKAVRYLKPVQTGSESDSHAVMQLAGLDASSVLPPAMSLELPASIDQAAGAEGVEVTAEAIQGACAERLNAEPDAAWVLECAGGLRVPLNAVEDQADWLAGLGAPLVLVARSGLGTLNHTLLSLEACFRRGLAVRALFLVGEPHADNLRTLQARLPALPIFVLPPLQPLSTQSLDTWLGHNDVSEVLR